MNSSMTKNKNFWEIRPLTNEMIEYATQDVVYLEQVYELQKEQCLDFENGHEVLKNVLESCQATKGYLRIN